MKFYDEHTDEKQNRDDNKILQPSSNGADLGSKSSSQSIPTTPSPRPPAPEPKRKEMTPANDIKVHEGMSCHQDIVSPTSMSYFGPNCSRHFGIST